MARIVRRFSDPPNVTSGTPINWKTNQASDSLTLTYETDPVGDDASLLGVLFTWSRDYPSEPPPAIIRFDPDVAPDQRFYDSFQLVASQDSVGIVGGNEQGQSHLRAYTVSLDGLTGFQWFAGFDTTFAVPFGWAIGAAVLYVFDVADSGTLLHDDAGRVRVADFGVNTTPPTPSSTQRVQQFAAYGPAGFGGGGGSVGSPYDESYSISVPGGELFTWSAHGSHAPDLSDLVDAYEDAVSMWVLLEVVPSGAPRLRQRQRDDHAPRAARQNAPTSRQEGNRASQQNSYH